MIFESQCTLGDGARYEIWNQRRVLADLLPRFTQSPLGPKDGTCFTPAIFSGNRRNKMQAVEIGVVVLDSDCGHELHEITAALDAAGYEAIIHSTYSHLT